MGMPRGTPFCGVVPVVSLAPTCAFVVGSWSSAHAAPSCAEAQADITRHDEKHPKTLSFAPLPHKQQGQSCRSRLRAGVSVAMFEMQSCLDHA